MKNLIHILAILGFLFISVIPAQAGDIGFNINVNLGNTSGQVVFNEPPVFIAPPTLGFYVAVGIPYDMFLIGSNYYLNRNGLWYVASGYNGPWIIVQYGQLPLGLRSHKYEQLIRIRDEEYRNYEYDRDHYRGKQYRPKKHEIWEGNALGQIVFNEPPVFIAPPSLGFYTAVGIPHDMFLIGSNYYMCMNGIWYVASGYNGPWVTIQYGQLPLGLRWRKYEQIIKSRDEEYRNYQQNRDHYRGKQYRPEKHEVWKGNKEYNSGGKHNKGHDNK